MPFKKAEKTASRLKLYVYGESGTGKTVTALSFPSPAVIDAERGTIFYGDKFDFDVKYTSNPTEVMTLIRELIIDPSGYKSLVIDPFTTIYEAILDQQTMFMRKKTGNKTYELKPLDYKAIKSQVRTIVQMLLALDMNIIVTARSKTLYESSDGNFMKVVGTQPDGPKNLPYLFDTVIELEKTAEGKRLAHVEKDRSNKLPEVFEFSYEALVEYWGLEGFEREPVQFVAQKKLDEMTGRHVEISLDGKPLMTAGITAPQIKTLQKLAKELGEEVFSGMLQTDYMISSVLDLKEDEADTLIKDASGAANK